MAIATTDGAVEFLVRHSARLHEMLMRAPQSGRSTAKDFGMVPESLVPVALGGSVPRERGTQTAVSGSRYCLLPRPCRGGDEQGQRYPRGGSSVQAEIEIVKERKECRADDRRTWKKFRRM